MLALPAPALAQQSPSPSVDQYVERVPTAEGPKPSAAGPKYKRNAKLPENVRERLREEGGEDAQALEDITTAAGLGAPGPPQGEREAGGAPRRGSPVPGGTPSRAVPGDGTGKGTVPAIAGAAFGSGSATALLVGGLLLTTAVMGAAALSRRRRETA